MRSDQDVPGHMRYFQIDKRKEIAAIAGQDVSMAIQQAADSAAGPDVVEPVSMKVFSDLIFGHVATEPY